MSGPGFRADVDWSDVAAQYLHGPMVGTGGSVSMARGEVIGGEGGCRGAGGGGGGAAAVGSRADVLDQGIVAHGDVSAGGGKIGLFAEDS